MTTTDQKTKLHQYLRFAREAMLWKVEGLSEYDVRRPLTPTGTNLLGLIKHLTLIEGGYFGDTFGRPFPEKLAFGEDDTEQNWARADESRDELVDLYRRVIAHSDATIDALDLDSTGSVPWWGDNEVTLFGILVHVLAEVNRHAGHADILREDLDGRVGLLADNANMRPHDEQWWKDKRARIQQAADTFR